MRKVWIAADCIVSPLGMTTAENYSQLQQAITGVKQELRPELSPGPVCISRISSLPVLERDDSPTRFETVSLLALSGVGKSIRLPGNKTLFILSTTKGNIELLDAGKPDHSRISLHAVARVLASEIGIQDPIVVSNACVSGVMALIMAKRLIETGNVDHAVVVGADILSRFVISGFQSLLALSATPCRPFDAARNGTNLGESAAAIILSAHPEELGGARTVSIAGGGLSNDANHISGPSRTGEELAQAIRQAMDEAGVAVPDIDFVSAHGTATAYNDEMEAKAFNLTGFQNTPLHSLKGYFGHTLGAAGVLETVISAHILRRGELLPSIGYETPGEFPSLRVVTTREKMNMRTALKTASGFGGCNAALVLEKNE